MTTTEASGDAKRRKPHVLTVLLVLIILVLGGLFAVTLLRYKQLSKENNRTGQQQANELAATIGKTVALPDEQAAVATVVDHTKLGDSQLAAEARNGDQLLVFSKARRVILYRPGSEQVIDMFHVTAEQAKQSQAASASADSDKKQ